MKVVLILFLLVSSSLMAESSEHILAPVESTPHLISGVEVSVITQSEWPRPQSRFSQKTVVLQLRITNRTGEMILFPTFDSFFTSLKTPDGKVMPLVGGRDATRISPNILLQPKASFSIPIKATLRLPDSENRVSLTIEDGTGSVATTELQAGDYQIFFEVFSTHYDFEQEGKLSAPLWKGKGATNPIGFTVK